MAQDRETCSNASLHGSFGLRATGNTMTVGALIVLGRFTFDGQNLTAKLYEFHRPNMMRWNPYENVLSVNNVGRLHRKWSYLTG
jgi:hypothetical protein